MGQLQSSWPFLMGNISPAKTSMKLGLVFLRIDPNRNSSGGATMKKLGWWRLPALMFAAGLAVLATQNASVQAQEPEHFQKTFTVSPGATLNIENYKGTIHVAAAEGNQVVVDVQKRFEGSESDRRWW